MIVDAPSGSTSSTIEENLGFWIDETAKTIVLADGMPLTVRRFDGTWISATRGDMSYELEPIREVWIHGEAFAASRLSMMRIMARRMNAATVVA